MLKEENVSKVVFIYLSYLSIYLSIDIDITPIYRRYICWCLSSCCSDASCNKLRENPPERGLLSLHTQPQSTGRAQICTYYWIVYQLYHYIFGNVQN